MKVLVTGGAGYIGSHVARQLARQGYEIRIYDNLSTGHRRLASGFEFVAGAIQDDRSLRPALDGVDAVMHFAGDTNVAESVANPRKYFQNNASNALAMLDTILGAGIRYFLFSSSAAVYGVPTITPIPESAPRKPVNPYGTSKMFFENVLEAYSAAYDLRSVSLRYFNAAGADESGEIGEMHEPETHLIPSILLVAVGAKDELQIFGNDYPTPDGTCVRDYIHVNDLATGHVAALQYLLDGGRSIAFNIGNGIGYSVQQIISAAEATTGKTIPRRFIPRRPGDPPALVADPSDAMEKLHWAPTRNLDGILSTAWAWTQKNFAPAAIATFGERGTGHAVVARRPRT